MRLTMTSEMRDEYAKKLAEIYNDYQYSGAKGNVPEKLLNSTDYKKVLKEFLRELISNNVADPKGDITTIITTDPEEGDKDFDELAELAIDFLIGIDVKRSKKNRLYPNITQVPMEDLNSYRDDLLRIMIANEMVKSKMNSQKWIKKWAGELNKWDRRGINDFAKASTQKSGLPGMFEKAKNKKAVKKQNPSPINLRGLNDVLNTLTEGKNLVELTPQIYKMLGANKVKANSSSPKINQQEQPEVTEESTTTTAEQE